VFPVTGNIREFGGNNPFSLLTVSAFGLGGAVAGHDSPFPGGGVSGDFNATASNLTPRGKEPFCFYGCGRSLR